jgi:hypothetical protein
MRENSTVWDAAQKYIPKFAAFGYDLHDAFVDSRSEILPPLLILEFLSRKLGMEIGVSFFPAKKGRGGRFGVRLINSENLRLDVEDFLRNHRRDDLLPYFEYRDPETDIAEFSKDFFEVLMRLFCTDMRRIISGNSFEETPIDWQGYK